MSSSNDFEAPTDLPNERTASSGVAGRPAPAPDADNVGVSAAEVEDDDGTLDLSFLLPSANSEALGRIGGYDVLGVEGCGGMGIVLKAFDHGLNRVVAIKVPALELASSRRFRARFQREARAVAAISHPNVVTIHEIDEHQGLPYLVMEFIAGRTLRDRIAQGVPFHAADILRIAAQIADGLEAAHRCGVIHRDLKPSNIMLENGIERVKITDFGLARAALDQSGLTSVGRIVGTPAYMPPEQLRDGKADVRSDLFGLGCVMYAMAAGTSPFRGSHTLEIIQKVSEVVPPPLHEVHPGLPPELSAIVSRLLEKDPDDRYQSAAEVATELTRLLSAVHQDRSGAATFRNPEASAARPQRAVESTASRPARRAAPVVAAIAVLGLVLSIPWWLPRADEQPSADRPAGPAATPAGGQPAAAAGTPAGPPAEIAAPADERSPDTRAVEWVLDLGGTADVLVSGVKHSVGDAGSLPDGDLAVIAIDLSRKERAAGGLEHLKGLTQLQVLKLYAVPVNDADLEHIAGLTSLQELDLYSAQITDSGLERLSALTGLESLSIHDTQITDLGLVHLSALEGLRRLNLARTGISDDGLRSLEPLRNLHWLQLSHTRVTEAGLEYLEGRTRLRDLYLTGLPLSDEALASLQAALPDCEINVD